MVSASQMASVSTVEKRTGASQIQASGKVVPTFWNGCTSGTWTTGIPDNCFYQDVQAFHLRS